MRREARNRLRSVVIRSRELLEADVKTLLRRLGIREGFELMPSEKLEHLSADERDTRERIIEAIHKEKAGGITEEEAYERFVRHTSFTYLNRLAAIRAMEVRKLIKETILRRPDYGGMSRREYELSERLEINDPDDLLRVSIIGAFEEVSSEIKVLFDIDNEYSLVFPSPRVIRELLKLLGEEIPEEDWLEDDVIGWIYQYYCSFEREQFRKEKRRPRPDDIPVINQFYTPRWIVRALVDNTLGRLWLEMIGEMPITGEGAPSAEKIKHPSGDNVAEYCTYLIPPSEKPPEREKKKVREIKILDPACGSGHFLVYAFDVLYRMYLEDEPDTPKEKIPTLILENNLYGIDIDLRAVQLAALSLFLKAKQYDHEINIKSMNLVCADARITDGDAQKRFLKRLSHDRELQKRFASVFKNLRYTYDVGSLLKVRKPFEELFRERYNKGSTVFRTQLVGQTSFSTEDGLGGQSILSEKSRVEIVPATPSELVDEMIRFLLDYEREAFEKRDMGTMLFAAEAEKSTGLLKLLSQNYDVVVMNPPYGDMPSNTKKYVKKQYPRTFYDYYSAFIERAIELCEAKGFVGMLTGRTFMFLKWFEKVRTEILWEESRPEVLLDLNNIPTDNILDEATGRWAATITKKTDSQGGDSKCTFCRLTVIQGEKEKIKAFEEMVLAWCDKGEHENLYSIRLSTLEKLPRMPYSYWVPDHLADLFENYPPLDKDNADKPNELKITDLKQGLATADNNRFVRYWWEVNSEKITLNKEETFSGKKWVPFVKGGEAYYSEIPLVVNWANNGREMKKFAEDTGKPRIQNETFYFQPGLCWSNIVSSVLMDFRPLPKGVIFSSDALSLFPKYHDDIFTMISNLNSKLLSFCFLALDPTMHHRHIGYVSQLAINTKIFENVVLRNLSNDIYSLKREWASGNEKSINFIEPWILQSYHGIDTLSRPCTNHPLNNTFHWSDSEICERIQNMQSSMNSTIVELAKLCVTREKKVNSHLNELQSKIDDIIYDIYNISKKDIEIIENELRILQGDSKKHNEKVKSYITIEEHVFRLLSYYVKLIIESDSDGIIILNSLINGVKQYLADDFNNKNEKVESDISEILGTRLESWLTNELFKFHVSLYERRPIIWHLTSANLSRKKGYTGAFNCFLHYHKLDQDTIPKIRSKHLLPQIEQTQRRIDNLRNELTMAKNSEDHERIRRLEKQLDEILDNLDELKEFDRRLEEVRHPRTKKTRLGRNPTWVQKAIAEIRDDGWKPIIDYGVRVNIEPLKEADLLHRAARRVK